MPLKVLEQHKQKIEKPTHYDVKLTNNNKTITNESR